jgi:hypothetical protein
MTIQIELSAEQRAAIQATVESQAKQIVAAAAGAKPLPADHFVFFAAFDGTNNDLYNVQDKYNTNVAQLYQQAQAPTANTPYLSANYYAGPGTKGTLRNSTWAEGPVTEQIVLTARKAYEDFTRQASAWARRSRRKRVSAVVTGFSRGCASAAIFSQMLWQNGLRDPVDGKVWFKPGSIPVCCGVLFDPVMTRVTVNVALAPNVEHIVQIRAQDEYRYLFKAADYSSQACVRCIDVPGCHCDVGGGYDNGIAALTLTAATQYLQHWIPLGDVAPTRAFAGVNEIAIHSEELDDTGNRKWDVYDTFKSLCILDPSPRQVDKELEILPAADQADGMRRMTLYDLSDCSV